MNHKMCSRLFVFGLVALALGIAQPSWALTSTGFLPTLENFGVQLYNFCVGFLVPFASYAALLFLVLNLFFGWVRLAPKVIGLIAGISIIGAGLPWLSTMWGGTIATSFTLPLP